YHKQQRDGDRRSRQQQLRFFPLGRSGRDRLRRRRRGGLRDHGLFRRRGGRGGKRRHRYGLGHRRSPPGSGFVGGLPRRRHRGQRGLTVFDTRGQGLGGRVFGFQAKRFEHQRGGGWTVGIGDAARLLEQRIHQHGADYGVARVQAVRLTQHRQSLL